MVRVTYLKSIFIVNFFYLFLFYISLTKNYRFRPKYPELMELPFFKQYEQTHIDVAAWFATISDTSGLQSHSR